MNLLSDRRRYGIRRYVPSTCRKTTTLNFICGLTMGVVCAFSLVTYQCERPGHQLSSRRKILLQPRHLVGGADWGGNRTDGREKPERVPEPRGSMLSHKDLVRIQQKIRPVDFQDSHAHYDDNKVAEDLKKKVRVLCWIMTCPKNLDKKAVHVRNTWARRCNKLLFISSVHNDSFPTIGFNISEGRRHLTAKTMMAFRYVYEHHLDDADWFMKADDDTYVIMENMRYFLSSQDPDDPIYFGHHFKRIVKQGYFSGGAGYVLSKESLRRLGKRGNDSKVCRQDGGSEDAEFGKCMENLGVKVGNSTDSLGRSRFHCFGAEKHLHGGYPKWYYRYDAHGAHKGRVSISDYAITFHYVPPQKMYNLEYYIYHLRPYGIRSGLQDLNKKKT